MKNVICFSDNRADVEVAFRDYMGHYMTEVAKRDGYTYNKNVSFEEKEAKMNKLMMSEITKLSGVNLNNSMVSAEMMASNPVLRWASFAVVDSMIDMIVPDVIDKSIGIYTEQRYGAMGDSFNFVVEPNDLFYVSKVGRDRRVSEFQKQFPGQTTILPENRAISVSVNFYKVVCGKESLAKFVMKAVMSLEAQITKEVYIAFSTAMGQLPTSAVSGDLTATGWSADSAIAIAQRVEAFNGGAAPVFLGTKLALSKILPATGAANSGYRYIIDSDYVKVGYLRNFYGYDAMEMRQVADWKSPYKTVLNDKKIYVISPATQKPVKLCYEGSAITRTYDFNDNADLESTTTINKSYGIGIATNAIAGLITLQ